MLASDLIEDKGELLDGGDDDLLIGLDELAEIAGALGMAHRRGDLGELLDGVPYLLVKDAPVGDDDDGIEDFLLILFEANELVGEPGDRVRLAAACRVLDQVASTGTNLPGVGKEFTNYVELVVTRENLFSLLSAGLFVFFLDDLCVVLQDICQALTGEDVFPEEVRLEPVRVRGVAGTVVVAQVEGEEPRRLPRKMGAETHPVFVHGEVRDAATELEELLPRVAVALVLLDCVLDGLFGQVVLQLECGDRQAVDEEAEVEGIPCFITAVAELARDAEPVESIAFGGFHVPRRGGAVKEVDVVRAVLEPVAQHVDGAAPGDLALEPGEELAPGWIVAVEFERFGDIRLRRTQEEGELCEVDTVLAVVVSGTAADVSCTAVGGCVVGYRAAALLRVAGCTGQCGADQAFEALFGGVG